MLALTPLVLQLISLGISVAPELIAAAEQEISLVTGTSAPTAAQQAQITAAVVAANAALQAAQPGPAT
jgi:uncharacterized membrane-anchored protein